MIIIKHKGGWSASNNAWLDTKHTPVMVDGKLSHIKEEKVVRWENPYTVEGELTGDVMIAIRDTTTGQVFYYDATLQGKMSAIIKGEVDKKFLVTL